MAAYSYMALVPIVQPPVIRAAARRRRSAGSAWNTRGTKVSKTTKILFPIVVTDPCRVWFRRAAVALIGFLMFGNLIRECGVLNALSETAQKVLANLITLLLGHHDRVEDDGGRSS